jgi:hypothetical protein
MACAFHPPTDKGLRMFQPYETVGTAQTWLDIKEAIRYLRYSYRVLYLLS